MPRLSTSLLRRARAIDPLLPPLLPPCRDLRAAQNELRWLREHADKVTKGGDTKDKVTLLRQLVHDRASGKPLQYILGTEFFGPLELQCRPGVLIPRQETAASVTHLAQLLRRSAQHFPSELRVLDLCTGTGCIPLLFHHEFYAARDDVQLRLLGMDISEQAVDLAQHNLKRVRQSNGQHSKGSVRFLRADVLIDPYGDQTLNPPCVKAALNFNREPHYWDVLISNPPYISPTAYWKTTTRSVRGFEPKLALVPPPMEEASNTERGDEFYPRILSIARDVEAKVVLLEVADLNQAHRVARMARNLDIFDGIEIWRDHPQDARQEENSANHHQHEFPVIGAGNGRSVLCWRAAGAPWLGKSNGSWNDLDDAKRLFRSYQLNHQSLGEMHESNKVLSAAALSYWKRERGDIG